MATKQKDRILIVEQDPIIADFVSRQSLQAAGYDTRVVNDSSSAIAQAVQNPPDALIIDLNMPGLSGKDVMVALTSQGVDVPVIILTLKGTEASIINTFRLGAADYLLWPLREAEVLTVVERVLKQTHARREREQLASQLQSANQELQQRVRELTAIYSIGKVVTSITDQALLFEKLLEGTAKATQADLGWFLLRDEKRDVFLLVAQRNLPPSMMAYLNQPWDDGVSSLVALSGQSLSISGEPLNRFKIASLGKSALIVPVKAQKQVMGLLVVMRAKGQPFNPSEQNLLEAVVDYAAISLVNARLFRALEERAHALQSMADSSRIQALSGFKKDLLPHLGRALEALKELEKTRLDRGQKSKLASLQEQIQKLTTKIERADITKPRGME